MILRPVLGACIAATVAQAAVAGCNDLVEGDLSDAQCQRIEALIVEAQTAFYLRGFNNACARVNRSSGLRTQLLNQTDPVRIDCVVYPQYGALPGTPVGNSMFGQVPSSNGYSAPSGYFNGGSQPFFGPFGAGPVLNVNPR